MKTGYIIASVAVLALLGIGGWSVYQSNQPSMLDGFAQCLTEKGAIFYGAFWCPHCQNTKKLFGSAMRYVTYVECSTPDGKGQLPICKEKNIQGYPTWIFSDGSSLQGELTLEQLAEKTACELPKTQ